MDICICDKTNNTLARVLERNYLVPERDAALPENSDCAFCLGLAHEELGGFDILLDGESQRALATHQGPFFRSTTEEGRYRTNYHQWFESKAGPVRLEIRRQLYGSRICEVVCDKEIYIDPVKMGGLQNHARACKKLEQSPFPSIFKDGRPPPSNSTIYEKWAFYCTCEALACVGGLKLTPIITDWENSVQGSAFTSGPVLTCDLSSNMRLRVRHEPFVEQIGSVSRPDELYTLRGHSLRPDLSVELLVKESYVDDWSLSAAVVGDYKYAEAAGPTRRYKWREVDHSYAHIVNARREAIRQLWLISSAGDSAGISDGPADGTVCMMPYNEDYVFAKQGFKRQHLIVQPAEGYEKYFKAFAASALDSLLGRTS